MSDILMTDDEESVKISVPKKSERPLNIQVKKEDKTEEKKTEVPQLELFD